MDRQPTAYPLQGERKRVCRIHMMKGRLTWWVSNAFARNESWSGFWGCHHWRSERVTWGRGEIRVRLIDGSRAKVR